MHKSRKVFFLVDVKYSDWIVTRLKSICNVDDDLAFFCFVSDVQKDFKYIQHSDIEKVIYGSEAFWDKLGDLTKIQSVHVHYLEQNVAHFVWHFKPKYNFKVIWYLWGADFYTLLTSYVLYLPETQALLNEIGTKQTAMAKTLKKVKDRLKSFLGRQSKSLNVKVIASMIDVIASGFDSEFNLVSKYIPGTYRHNKYFFLSVNELFQGPEYESEELGSDILIGNSGDPANNHLEAFSLIKMSGVLNMVHCPLAYGNQDYIRLITAKGSKMLGGRFDPWLTYSSRETYNNQLRKVGFAIFNNIRQQAFGNIVTLLWLGAKIFLREENPIYQDLKKWGFVVFEIKSSLNKADFEAPLITSQIKHNRMLLEKTMNETTIRKYYRDLLEV